MELCFDHHKRSPFTNLFTDPALGAGTRMYRSGGGAALGKHRGAWTTFWDIRAARPPAKFAPDCVNLVGVISRNASLKNKTAR